MSKFCQNCGNMLEDNAAFCDKCGKPFEAPEVPAAAAAPEAPQYQAPQYEAPQYQAPQYQAPQYEAPQYGAQPVGTVVAQKKNPLAGVLKFIKEKKIFVIGGAAVLVLIIVLIIILSSCGANSPEGAIKKAVDSAKNLDIRGAASVSYEMNFDKDKNFDEEVKKQEEQIKQLGSMVDMYKQMLKNASIKVTKDEAVTADEMKSYQESWASSYKDTDKISEIHKVEYEVSGVMGQTSNGSCLAVKVGGKWYLKEFSGVGGF